MDEETIIAVTSDSMDAGGNIISRDLNYWDRIADCYDVALVNEDTAEIESRNFEDFEEEYVQSIINEQVKNGNKLTFIEIGCGTGRYLKQLVSNENIKLLIGIDFSQKMVENAITNIKKFNFPGTFDNKVIMVRGLGEKVLVSPWRSNTTRDTIPIVICAFNTLGNIETAERRFEIINNIKQAIGENGVGIISVFNTDFFSDLGMKYYMDDSIKELIVPNHTRAELKDLFKYIKNAIVGKDFGKLSKLISSDSSKSIMLKDDCEIKTDDFYSHWFGVDEICDLIKATGLHINECVVGANNPDSRAKRGILIKVTGNDLHTN